MIQKCLDFVHHYFISITPHIFYMFLIVYMYICRYLQPYMYEWCMNDVYMARPTKIVIVLSLLPNWNKIVNQSIKEPYLMKVLVKVSTQEKNRLCFHGPDKIENISYIAVKLPVIRSLSLHGHL